MHRNSIIVKEAEAVLQVRKLIGIVYEGNEDGFVVRITNLEAKDRDFNQEGGNRVQP